MTKSEIKKAADRVQDLLLDLASAEEIELTGAERDAIGEMRDLCSRIADGEWWAS